MTEEELEAISRRNSDTDDISDRDEFDDIDDIPDIPEFSAFSDDPDESDVYGDKAVDYSYDTDDADDIDDDDSDDDLYYDLNAGSVVHATQKKEREQEVRAIIQGNTAFVTAPVSAPVSVPGPAPVREERPVPEKPAEEIQKNASEPEPVRAPEPTPVPAERPAPAPAEKAVAEKPAAPEAKGAEPEKPTHTPGSMHITNVEVTGANHVRVNKIYILNTVISMVTLCVIAAGIFTGYVYIKRLEDELGINRNRLNALEEKAAGEQSSDDTDKTSDSDKDAIDAISLIDEEELNEPKAPANDEIELDRGKILIYDSYVGYGWVPVLSGVKTNEYRQEDFSIDENYRMKYVKDGEESSYFGIDVSSFQGDIDWNAVRSDGVEFAILRIGVRGYGEEGNIRFDEKFEQNYENAHKAGVDLGVYFYSQAISVDEAVEEAKFVLEKLDGRPLEYPIVFDWEPVDPNTAEGTPRTEDVMPGTLTLGARAFCETVKDAGYDAMIYTNKKMAYIKYDMRQLADYPVWLALYSTDLTYYYDFDIWQYGFGRVDGIEGDVDLDIAIIR